MQLTINNHHYFVPFELISVLKKTFLAYYLKDNSDNKSIKINLSSNNDLPSVIRIIDYLLKIENHLQWNLDSENWIINQLYQLQFCRLDLDLYFDYPDFDPFNYPSSVANLYWKKVELNFNDFKYKIPVFNFGPESRYLAYFNQGEYLILFNYQTRRSLVIDFQRAKDCNYYLFDRNDKSDRSDQLYLFRTSVAPVHAIELIDYGLYIYSIDLNCVNQEGKVKITYRTSITLNTYFNFDSRSLIRFPSFIDIYSDKIYIYVALDDDQYREFIPFNRSKVEIKYLDQDNNSQISNPQNNNLNQNNVNIVQVGDRTFCPPSFFSNNQEYQYVNINVQSNIEYLNDHVIVNSNFAFIKGRMVLTNLINDNCYWFNRSEDKDQPYSIYINKYHSLIFLFLRHKTLDEFQVLTVLDNEILKPLTLKVQWSGSVDRTINKTIDETVNGIIDEKTDDQLMINVNNRINFCRFTESHIFLCFDSTIKIYQYKYHSSQGQLVMKLLETPSILNFHHDIMINDGQTFITHNFNDRRKCLIYHQKGI